MYNASEYARELLRKNYRQTVRITYQDGDTEKYITEKDIIQGSFSIDRYCTSGNSIEIGSAIAAEMSLELDNRDGRFDNTSFEGVEMFVEIGVMKWDAYTWEKAKVEYIPCGYFTVDQPPRRLSTISLTGLDRMARFDKLVDPSIWMLYGNVSYLIAVICQTKIGVPIWSLDAFQLLPNAKYKLGDYPEEDNLTYRKLIQWIASITGTCAYIDWEGKLRFEWFGDSIPQNTSVTIGLSDRFSSQLEEVPISITGVKIDIGDDQVYVVGDDAYCMELEDNGLLYGDVRTTVDNVYDRVKGLTYLPFECESKPMPYLWPLDTISVQDKNGEWHDSVVTHVHFTVNGKTTVKAVGETSIGKSHAKSSPMTNSQTVAVKKTVEKRIKDTEEKISAELSGREQALMVFNEVMANAMGLYFSKEELEDGSFRVYAHDKKIAGNTLEQNLKRSSVVYTINDQGFAWTTDYKGAAGTSWEYGISKDGNAILNTIIANKISADIIQGGFLISENGESWLNLSTGTFSFGGNKLRLGNDGVLTIGNDKLKLLPNGTISLNGSLQSSAETIKAHVGTDTAVGAESFTVTDMMAGGGDIFSVYSLTNGGVIWTVPKFTSGNGRKGIYINQNAIGIFADGSGCSIEIDQSTKAVKINGGKIYINNESLSNILSRISALEEKVK